MKSEKQVPFLPPYQDHPRVCGEKFFVDEVLPGDTGSPPRMRGKGRGAHSFLPFPGITPAYAGKRDVSRIFAYPHRDHPRVCGEKPHLTPAIDRSKGSPPRMRGKAVPAALPDVTHGITPAYAGKSCSNAPKNRTTWDHPRVCGEKHLPAAAMQGCPGITPACAGKRRSVAAAARSRRDHPRVCGEKAPE